MKLGITNVEYIIDEARNPIIKLFGRDKSGNAHTVDVFGFKPYCYVPSLELSQKTTESVNVLPETHTAINGIGVQKLITRLPGDVKALREMFTVFEGDVPFTNRFLIDHNILRGISTATHRVHCSEVNPENELMVPLRTCILDIECNDARGYPKAERDAILCITVWDSFENHYTTFAWKTNSEEWEFSTRDNWTKSIHTSERTMLEEFIKWMRKTNPDVIAGWNVDNFDIPYIVTRLKKYNRGAYDLSRLPEVRSKNYDRIRGRSNFDLLTAYKKLHVTRKDSYKLDAVAEQELERRKIPLKHSMHHLFLNDQETLFEYNRVDVELCVAIEKKKNLIAFFRELALFVGIPLERAIYSSNLIDMLVLRAAHGKYVLPSKTKEVHQTVDGARVFEAVNGIFENVVVFDIKSLYPMAILTLNMSRETKDTKGEYKAPNGIRFKTEPEGLAKNILTTLLQARKEKRTERDKHPYNSDEWTLYDMQQAAIKVVMNTYYGVSLYPHFRLYDPDIGSAVTSVGRAIIAYTRDVIEQAGYNVLYGDTDSCMVQIPNASVEKTLDVARDLENKINEAYNTFAREELNAETHHFEIRFEKIFRLFFQPGTQKRYAGHLIWKEGEFVDNIDVVGFELKRSDSALVTRETQQKLFELIFSTGNVEEARKHLRNIIKQFRNGEYSPDYIGIPGGFSKPLDEYEYPDAHVRGALYSNDYLGMSFQAGDKAKRIYIRNVTEKYPQTDVVCFEHGNQIPEEFVVDYERMLVLTLKNPLTRILDSFRLTWELVDPAHTSLFDFGMEAA